MWNFWYKKYGTRVNNWQRNNELQQIDFFYAKSFLEYAFDFFNPSIKK